MRNVVITGPTCSGKTSVAVDLAESTGGEIISADSRQVYRKMDIGTAKPGPEETRRAPHHLIDILDPDERYTAADFRRDAEDKIREIRGKGKLPVIAGGTWLYIKALVDGIFEGPAGNGKVRAELEEQASSSGTMNLHMELSKIDPSSAGKIHPNDRRRIIRALEIYKLTGKPPSRVKKWRNSSPDYLMFGLFPERGKLYSEINARTDMMFREGFVEEVENLAANGCTEEFISMEAVGYREVISFLKGRSTLDEAREKTKAATRRYARRQLTWLRSEKRIIRIQTVPGEPASRAAGIIKGFLS